LWMLHKKTIVVESQLVWKKKSLLKLMMIFCDNYNYLKIAKKLFANTH
jgi:hypothetical protein